MEYRLTWSDEFAYHGRPDPEKWSYDLGGTGFGNREQQYYTERLINAEVRDNCLAITGYREAYQNQQYTSARLTTRGIKNFQYGKLVIRAQIPTGVGTWPAIWMLPESFHHGLKWPDCGEIDIMEHVGKNKDVIHFSLHTKSYNLMAGNQYTKFDRFNGISDRFAEYSIIWTAEYLEFLIDEQPYAKFSKGEAGKSSQQDGWPFDQPFYLILNLALGGYWGGPIDDSIFPVRFLIDYVRYYQIIE